MLETLLTLVFLVTGSDSGLLRLEASARGLAAAGDPAIVFQLETASGDGLGSWRELGEGRVVDLGDGLAVVSSAAREIDDVSALRIAVRVPSERLATGGDAAPDAVLERAGALLAGSADDQLAAAVARAVPTDERVELAVLTLLQARWTARQSSLETPSGRGAPRAGGAPAAEAERGRNAASPAGAVSDGDLPDRRVPGTGEEPPSVGITARVRQWAAARAAGDLDAVLDFYADGFVPAGGASRTDWAEQLRATLAVRRAIVLEGLDAGFLGGADRARVTFTERVSQGGVARPPRTVRLILVWDREDWRILEESPAEAP